jgi:uridine kinase
VATSRSSAPGEQDRLSVTADAGVAAFPLSRAELIDLLADTVEARSAGRPVRVAVDGCAAAGKTTLADELVAVLRDRGRHVIRAWVDDFLYPRNERHRRGLYSAQGCYRDAFDYPALIGRLLDPLGPGGTREYQTAVYDRHADKAVCPAAAEAPADAVLVLDGVFLLRPELRVSWDLKIHLSVQPSEILRRGRIRDLDVYGSIDEVDRRYLRRYLPAQEIYQADDHPIEHADFIVINDDPARPVVHAGSAARARS